MKSIKAFSRRVREGRFVCNFIPAYWEPTPAIERVSTSTFSVSLENLKCLGCVSMTCATLAPAVGGKRWPLVLLVLPECHQQWGTSRKGHALCLPCSCLPSRSCSLFHMPPLSIAQRWQLPGEGSPSWVEVMHWGVSKTCQPVLLEGSQVEA